MPAAPPDPSSAETLIRPRRGLPNLGLGELLAARELLSILTWRDVKVRYKQTVLGAIWALLQPAAMTAVFSFVLQRWARLPPGDLPFALHVYLGMWIWVFFSTALSTSANSVVGAERVVTKVYFPRLAIPFAAVLASLVDFAIASLGFFALAWFYDVPPSASWLLAPLLVGLVALLAMGLGAGMAALMVVYRDVRYVLPFVVQLLLFATPSIYLATRAGGVEDGAAPPAAATDATHTVGAGTGLLDFHPLDGLVASFRAAMLGGEMPWQRLGLAALITALVFLAGCLLFRHLEDTFADVI